MDRVDTRTKIIQADEAARIANAGAIVVSGYFDPLVASHADRLAGLKRNGKPLLVLIARPENPILPPGARAELVAGLAAVDFVAETTCDLVPEISIEQEDDARLHALIAHVHARQQAAS